ncbi:response regulator, partial [Pseudomonas aeruginosa]
MTARDGQDAMDMLPLERLPEIVMVDMEMPRMTGLELTKALRARAEFNEVPIIMLTTRTNLEDEALRAGV